MISTTRIDFLWILSVAFASMIALATLLTLINQVVGTPYIPGGDSPAGTDCSELASWVSNAATARPVFGDRFNTGNEEAALAAQGFQQEPPQCLGDRLEWPPHGGDAARWHARIQW